MDLTPLNHIAVTVLAMAFIGIITGNWYLGGVLACFWWAGREHAQAEARWASTVGVRTKSPMPLYGGFDPRAWNLGSLLDLLLPVVITLGAWYFHTALLGIAMMTIIITLFIIMVALFAFDVYSTITILKNGGVELNGIMVSLMNKLGVAPAFFITKFIVTAIFAYLCFFAAWFPAALSITILAFICLVYTIVAVHNARSL